MGTGFPWSGYFYGGGQVMPNTELEPTRYAGPEVYKRAYRYVVDRVRARGANNVKWVLHLMNYPYPTDLWNQAEQYYPGTGILRLARHERLWSAVRQG